MKHQDQHGSDSRSTKSAYQPFCGCRFGFGAAFSEISKLVHDLTLRLNERGKELYNYYTKKRQYVAVPNDNRRRTFKNRENEHTPLLSRPKQKQKVTRKPKVTAAAQKRVLIPEVDIESLLTSAAKADWLAQDDIQGPSLVSPTKICSEPIDFITGTSNAFKIFVDSSYGLPTTRVLFPLHYWRCTILSTKPPHRREHTDPSSKLLSCHKPPQSQQIRKTEFVQVGQVRPGEAAGVNHESQSFFRNTVMRVGGK
ncbi:hypothetical protein BGZ52_001873 [Haplosporangium bisporale]|nr:hypothetical protein BGZ52_001873 [Haplosporangium bisporale]